MRAVAPRAGAWIETAAVNGAALMPWSLPVRERGSKRPVDGVENVLVWSLPVRERGSKLVGIELVAEADKVAPRAGAWIETPLFEGLCGLKCVAPRAGAWIETSA